MVNILCFIILEAMNLILDCSTHNLTGGAVFGWEMARM